MSQRFFVDTPIHGDTAELLDAEARHVSKVMRCRAGDELVVFDGSGCEFRAVIRQLGRDHVVLDVLERLEVDRELPFALVLGVALPKGDRQRWLVEKAVELGVSRLVPLVTERGVAQPEPKALARLQRAVIEASKQCGRNRLMEVGQPLPVAGFLANAPEEARRLFADPQATQPIETSRPDHDVHAAIGPEGGFSASELSAARDAGWQAVSLGKTILRVETAALALAAALAIPDGALGGRGRV